MTLLRSVEFRAEQELLHDHLQIVRPKFRMALAQKAHARGMLQLLGMKHRQLLLHFRGCDGVGHALHQDGRIFRSPSNGMRLRTATPIALQ